MISDYLKDNNYTSLNEIKTIVDTRNYYAHLTPQDNILNDVEMEKSIVQLMKILSSLLLLELKVHF